MSIKTASTPHFNHKEIRNLYLYNLDIPKELLTEIINLPKETLIQDLESILDDAEKRFGTLINEAMKGGPHSLIIHTLFILKEIKAENSLNKVLDFLDNDQSIILFWLGDHITETLWQVFFELAYNKPGVYKDFVLDPDIDLFTRDAAAQAMIQISLHDPSKRDEIKNIFSEWLNYFYEANEEDENLDTELIALIVSNVIDGDFEEFKPLIKKLYQMDRVSLDVFGDYEDFESEFEEKADYKRDIQTIFEIYDEVNEDWVSSDQMYED